MSWQPPVPVAAGTLADLRSVLATEDFLVGYDTVVDGVIAALGTTIPSATVRTGRWTGNHFVPCVLAVLDDCIVEGWLEAGAVHTECTPRPGRGATG